MYPFVRLIFQLRKFRHASELPLNGVHISRHMCWISDIDPWLEMNNGRMLTIYDLARLPFISRIPLAKALKDCGWRMTIAGHTVRYRRRIRLFDKIEIRSHALGRDARFIYIQQSMWVRGEAASSGIFRAAIVDENGIVPTSDVARQLGMPDWKPDMPSWVNDWISSEAKRVWPPEDGAL